MSKQQPSLEVVSKQPFNAGTPLTVLADQKTPAELTYIRNHFAVPELDIDSWRLYTTGAFDRGRDFTLAEIQTLPTKKLAITLECAGNGRTSMNPQPKGTPWGYGAVSVIEVKGTPLSNVMEQVGLHDHVVEISFKGADWGEVEPGREVSYVRSLPLEVALHPDTMLVWEMNGQPLSPDHGFPLRLHVPGWYGMAAVKWLTEVRALTEPFEGFFQSEHYVYLEEQGTPEAEPVRAMRVRALITSPISGDVLERGTFEIEGLAWSGNGEITQVELSFDQGGSWAITELHPPTSRYVPTRWTYRWTPESSGSYTLISRASDSSGKIQPMEQRWNQLGYGNNGVQVVEITVS